VGSRGVPLGYGASGVHPLWHPIQPPATITSLPQPIFPTTDQFSFAAERLPGIRLQVFCFPSNGLSQDHGHRRTPPRKAEAMKNRLAPVAPARRNKLMQSVQKRNQLWP
jgi:hypothetical protein